MHNDIADALAWSLVNVDTSVLHTKTIGVNRTDIPVFHFRIKSATFVYGDVYSHIDVFFHDIYMTKDKQIGLIISQKQLDMNTLQSSYGYKDFPLLYSNEYNTSGRIYSLRVNCTSIIYNGVEYMNCTADLEKFFNAIKNDCEQLQIVRGSRVEDKSVEVVVRHNDHNILYHVLAVNDCYYDDRIDIHFNPVVEPTQFQIKVSENNAAHIYTFSMNDNITFFIGQDKIKYEYKCEADTKIIMSNINLELTLNKM